MVNEEAPERRGSGRVGREGGGGGGGKRKRMRENCLASPTQTNRSYVMGISFLLAMGDGGYTRSENTKISPSRG